jgi:hypothetical protein
MLGFGSRKNAYFLKIERCLIKYFDVTANFMPVSPNKTKEPATFDRFFV